MATANFVTPSLRLVDITVPAAQAVLQRLKLQSRIAHGTTPFLSRQPMTEDIPSSGSRLEADLLPNELVHGRR